MHQAESVPENIIHKILEDLRYKLVTKFWS